MRGRHEVRTSWVLAGFVTIAAVGGCSGSVAGKGIAPSSKPRTDATQAVAAAKACADWQRDVVAAYNASAGGPVRAAVTAAPAGGQGYDMATKTFRCAASFAPAAASAVAAGVVTVTITGPDPTVDLECQSYWNRGANPEQDAVAKRIGGDALRYCPASSSSSAAPTPEFEPRHVTWLGGPQLRMDVVAPSGVIDLSSLLFSWLDSQGFAGNPETL